MVSGDQNLPGCRGPGDIVQGVILFLRSLQRSLCTLDCEFFLIHRFSDYHVADTRWISVDAGLFDHLVTSGVRACMPSRFSRV